MCSIICIKTSAHKSEFEGEKPHGSKLYNFLLVIGGSAVVIGGAYLLVAGGVEIAREKNVSEAVIGLTVLAVGTSLPELAATVAAAIKNQNEIGMGNIIGSNIFNFALVIGIVPVVFAIKDGSALKFELVAMDIYVMLAVVFALFFFVLFSKKKMFGRIAGVIFLLAYCAYITFCFKPEIF